MAQKQRSVIEDLARIDAESAAKALLGASLTRYINGQKLSGRIVETEAYHQEDAASHSYRGVTPKTEVMFGPAGHAYVYFTYGMHYCMNVVVGKEGYGAAVLIRALEPVTGIEHMAKYRFNKPLSRFNLDSKEQELTNGPAKLCQALNIDRKLNGHDLSQQPLLLEPADPVPSGQITTTTRIDIKDNARAQLRFYITANSYVSKP